MAYPSADGRPFSAVAKSPAQHKSKADSECTYVHDEKARKENMKAKQDWQFIGRFVGTLVQLFTIISTIFKKAGVGMEAIEWLVGSGKSFLTAKLAEITDEYKRQNPPPVPKIDEVTIDSIIRVNRSIRPSYPDWAKTVMHPELEGIGPTEYDGSSVEQWLHDGQKGGGRVVGNQVYDHLKDTDTLRTCLGLRDLEEIQKKGVAFFRKYFKGKAVFGWAGVVRHLNGSLFVPYLYEDGDEVVLDWDWAGHDWDDVYPALRFASSTEV